MYTINTNKSITITNSALPAYSSTYTQNAAGVDLATLTQAELDAYGAQLDAELELQVTTDAADNFISGLRAEFDYNMLNNSKYSKSEMSMFPILQAEYFNGVTTPYVDSLALARGITRTAMLAKIGVKIKEIAAAQGLLYKKKDIIRAATTMTELNSAIQTVDSL